MNRKVGKPRSPIFPTFPASLFQLRSWITTAFAVGFALLPIGAQVVELRATLTADQEVPGTGSPATGTGLMLYNVATNTFDLFINLSRYANLVTDSHVQEAPAGEIGPALIHFGDESVYTRSGGTVSANFLNRRYPGDPLKLLRSGAYLNLHSAQFPRGEIRGQLIARPKRLIALCSVAQEQAAFPGSTLASSAYGAAVMIFNPGTNQISLRLSVYAWGNTLTNSHFHEGPAGVSGPVVVGLGAGTASGYTNHGNGWWTGAFDLPYNGGDPLKLLTGGAYLNFHSNLFPNGEIRGQVIPSEETLSTRLVAVSSRGFVGSGSPVLIAGLAVTGPEPVRVLITAKGPSLAGFGIANPLRDPTLSLFDATGREIAVNDDIGPLGANAELTRVPGAPVNPSESALLLVLPPGNYTAVVSGAGGSSGVTLLEAVDLRGLGGFGAN